MYILLLMANLADQIGEKKDVETAVNEVVQSKVQQTFRTNPFLYVIQYILMFLILGYIIGFVCRKYLKIGFFFLVFFIISIKAFEYADLVHINWKEVFGITEHIMLDVQKNVESHYALSSVIAWLKGNWIKLLAGFTGFCGGYFPDEIADAFKSLERFF